MDIQHRVHVGLDGAQELQELAAAVPADWVERCRTRIFENDTTLDARDVLELANALADRPSCRAVAPESAADPSFAGGLGELAESER